MGIGLELASVVGDIYTTGKMTVDRYVGSLEMIQSMVRSTFAIYGYIITEGTQQSRTEIIEVDNNLVISETGGEPVRGAINEPYTFNNVRVHIVVGGETLDRKSVV